MTAPATSVWSVRRLAVATVLLAWAVVFWFLLVTSRTSLYLSPRTAWVVPTGAILLTLAAAGRLLTARTDRPEPSARRGGWAWWWSPRC